jgi:hypothetical protein
MNEILNDADENELLASYDRDEWESVNNVREELQRYQAYVAAMMEASHGLQ